MYRFSIVPLKSAGVDPKACLQVPDVVRGLGKRYTSRSASGRVHRGLWFFKSMKIQWFVRVLVRFLGIQKFDEVPELNITLNHSDLTRR